METAVIEIEDVQELVDDYNLTYETLRTLSFMLDDEKVALDDVLEFESSNITAEQVLCAIRAGLLEIDDYHAVVLSALGKAVIGTFNAEMSFEEWPADAADVRCLVFDD